MLLISVRDIVKLLSIGSLFTSVISNYLSLIATEVVTEPSRFTERNPPQPFPSGSYPGPSSSLESLE
jgi:hypothetical protein